MGLVFIFAQNFISLYRKALEARPGPIRGKAGAGAGGAEGLPPICGPAGPCLSKKKRGQKSRGHVSQNEKFTFFWPLVYIQKNDQTQIFAGLAASHTAFVFQIPEKYIQIFGGLYTNFGRFIYKFGAVYIQIKGGRA